MNKLSFTPKHVKTDILERFKELQNLKHKPLENKQKLRIFYLLHKIPLIDWVSMLNYQ